VTKLSINLNKIALLRNQRDVGYPDVVDAARKVIAAGAHGITVHPRPDQRHTRPSDVRDLAALVANELGGRVELNIEGNPTEDFLALVEEVRPTQVTLVPDAPDQRTSDHGWDLAADEARLRPIVARLARAGMRVSLFMDAEPAAMARAKATGAHRIELYTEPYARAFAAGDYAAELDRFAAAAEAAAAQGLGVNAGHDLNLANLPTLRRRLPMLLEVSIGHAFTADALELGYAAAVRAYLAALHAWDVAEASRVLEEATGRQVEPSDGERAYVFRLDRPSEPPHWLHVSHELIELEGDPGFRKRLPDIVPHLTTAGQSLLVTLTSNRVRAEPAADAISSGRESGSRPRE